MNSLYCNKPVSTKPMLLSVIIAVRNGGQTLARCIDSVISQTCSDIELIVIDGGSTDGTVEIIRSYSARLAYWESKADRGIAHAWNKGIGYASGEWILFLGADDYLWCEESIEQMRPFLEAARPRTLVVYGKAIGVDADGSALHELSSQWVQRKFVWYGMYFSHQGIFHNKRLFGDFGVFDEDYRYGLDYELLMRYLIDHDAEYVGAITVAAMQMGGLSNHPANAYKTLGDFRKARRKHGIEGDSLLFYRALIGAWAKCFLYTYTGWRRS
jgi:glycosyltransferase involved in cell wall biosynthesis